MDPRNLLILMSDEHNPKVMGCAGNEIVHTPNLDELAREGTRFTSAYTTCPICVPARASFALGKYVHQIGYWDNADAYDGAIPSWHHALRDQGHEVVSIGKLHFRGAPGDDHGFTTEIVPMHVIDGIGDVKGLVRENIPKRRGGDKMARLAGPGESPYTVYDRDIAARAQIWLHEAAKRAHDKPWVLFVSFVAPHFPLTAPPEWYYQYADRDLPLPKQYGHDVRPHHPFLDDYERVVDYDSHFRTREDIQRALAGYYGLVSATDEHIGHILTALKQSGLDGGTRVLYTSDHGDNLGARGLWGKSTFFEESAGVPLILAGDGIPVGIERATPVSLIDVYPFVFECVGAAAPDDRERPGVSLAALAEGMVPDRAVVSEYHATTSVAGAYMVRDGDFKYVHYVAYPAQLYDLRRDPEELNDVAGDPAYAETLARLRRRLLAILDPAEVDARAKRRQAELLARHGGREVALARGDLGFTPAPGTEPEID
jgi:choline-sulfatase